MHSTFTSEQKTFQISYAIKLLISYACFGLCWCQTSTSSRLIGFINPTLNTQSFNSPFWKFSELKGSAGNVTWWDRQRTVGIYVLILFAVSALSNSNHPFPLYPLENIPCLHQWLNMLMEHIIFHTTYYLKVLFYLQIFIRYNVLGLINLGMFCCRYLRTTRFCWCNVLWGWLTHLVQVSQTFPWQVVKSHWWYCWGMSPVCTLTQRAVILSSTQWGGSFLWVGKCHLRQKCVEINIFSLTNPLIITEAHKNEPNYYVFYYMPEKMWKHWNHHHHCSFLFTGRFHKVLIFHVLYTQYYWYWSTGDHSQVCDYQINKIRRRHVIYQVKKVQFGICLPILKRSSSTSGHQKIIRVICKRPFWKFAE